MLVFPWVGARGRVAPGSLIVSHGVCLSVCPCPQRLPFSSLHVSLSPKELPLPLSACRRSKYGEASCLAALPARSGGTLLSAARSAAPRSGSAGGNALGCLVFLVAARFYVQQRGWEGGLSSATALHPAAACPVRGKGLGK